MSLKFCTGVRDRGIIRKVLYGCERPAVLSKKFCVGVRDMRCRPKSSVAQKEDTLSCLSLRPRVE